MVSENGKKESILLTGGLGFIGSHTAAEMIQAGYRVVIADDLSNSEASVADRICQITGTRPDLYICDVADKEALEGIFCEQRDKGTPIGGVIHFAGYKAVGESVAQPLRYYRNNLDTTLSLLEVMARFGAHKFVFSSSATVYGMSEDVPFSEEQPAGECTNPYGWTKYMIEQILRDTAAADPGLRVVLLRYFNPIGAHPSGLIGEKPNGIPNNLMPYITQVAQGIRPKLNVFGNDYPTPDGTGVRDYIHVTDLARGHVAAMDYASREARDEAAGAATDASTSDTTGAAAGTAADAATGAAGGFCQVFNLGTGRGFSVLELVETFIRVNGVDVPYEITDRRPGDIATCYADTTKAGQILGWTAEKTIEDMCRDSWNFCETLNKVEMER